MKPTAQSTRNEQVTVCVAGCMHSGTSMITRILNICGMYLGKNLDLLDVEASGDPAGNWENVKFIYANNEIMKKFGERAVPTAQIQIAKKFLNDELKGNFVGWKDPNNSLTIGFWNQVVPDLKVVLCLRNPFDVAKSLSKSPIHKLDFVNGLVLWERHKTNILSQVSNSRLIVSRYENYFEEPELEIRTLLQRLGVTGLDSKYIEEATASIKPALRHYQDTSESNNDKQLAQRVDKLYQTLLALA